MESPTQRRILRVRGSATSKLAGSRRPRTSKPVLLRHSRNVAIAHVFVECLDYPPAEEWDGQEGTVAIICEKLDIRGGSKHEVKKVLKNVVAAHNKGITFTGEFDTSKMGRPVVIETDTASAQIIADALESGLSFVQARDLVNLHLEEEKEPLVTVSAIRGCYQRLGAKTIRIPKKRQGTTDIDSPWAKARVRFNTQFLIRSGKLESQEDADGTIPDYYNKEKLTCFMHTQVVWWDEKHRQSLIGGVGVRSEVLTFPRDKDGRIDLQNGAHETPDAEMRVVSISSATVLSSSFLAATHYFFSLCSSLPPFTEVREGNPTLSWSGCCIQVR
jgi:hypothetical protein